MALFQVVAERRHVGALAALEVARAVSRPLVVVGEDDELCRVKLEFVLLGRLVVEGLAEALADGALERVELFRPRSHVPKLSDHRRRSNALLRQAPPTAIVNLDPATTAPPRGFVQVILQCASTAGVHERGLARARTPEAAGKCGLDAQDTLAGAGPCAWVSRRLRLLVGGTSTRISTPSSSARASAAP